MKNKRIRFTITVKYHDSGEGYIIMEFMSTNVTKNTRYRGEKWCETIYFGGSKTISLHKISREKPRKVPQTWSKTQKT